MVFYRRVDVVVLLVQYKMESLNFERVILDKEVAGFHSNSFESRFSSSMKVLIPTFKVSSVRKQVIPWKMFDDYLQKENLLFTVEAGRGKWNECARCCDSSRNMFLSSVLQPRVGHNGKD